MGHGNEFDRGGEPCGRGVVEANRFREGSS